MHFMHGSAIRVAFLAPRRYSAPTMHGTGHIEFVSAAGAPRAGRPLPLSGRRTRRVRPCVAGVFA
jgi:hypothetical protein